MFPPRLVPVDDSLSSKNRSVSDIIFYGSRNFPILQHDLFDFERSITKVPHRTQATPDFSMDRSTDPGIITIAMDIGNTGRKEGNRPSRDTPSDKSKEPVPGEERELFYRGSVPPP
jgi:hypothetical protein